MLVDLESKESKYLFSKYASKDYNAHKKRITSLDWNMNGNKLASGSSDGSLKVFNLCFNILTFQDLELRKRHP